LKDDIVQFIDLKAQQARIKDKLDARIQTVLEHGTYIMGPEVGEFEANLSKFCGAKHSITCANGTDAIQIALMALGAEKNDAVFVPSFTFASTIEVVPLTGATPVMVDIDKNTLNMDPESLKRSIIVAKDLGLSPSIVIPVDLFGLPADYEAINEIARNENMKVIGDSAQGFGGTINGQVTGTFADITTTSFFPAKPLGCYGDGGAIFTNDNGLADLMKSIRVHGKGVEKYDNIRVGVNSRLDTLQAAILLEKLAIYPDEIVKRQQAAERYDDLLAGHFTTPFIPDGYKSVWAQYGIKTDQVSRDGLVEKLKGDGIPTMVYYPKPLHDQIAYKDYPRDPKGLANSEAAPREVLCLPMHPYLDEETQIKVANSLMN
jgi:dTDP-4-amino-4,6-dideoxygalactose transaminase